MRLAVFQRLNLWNTIKSVDSWFEKELNARLFLNHQRKIDYVMLTRFELNKSEDVVFLIKHTSCCKINSCNDLILKRL
jgi:hypothetical protein